MTMLRGQIGAGRADQCAAAKLYRRSVEVSKRLKPAIWSAEQKPPAVKHLPRRTPGRVRKAKETASERPTPRKLLLSQSLALPRSAS